MELVPADFTTLEDIRIQDLLNEHTLVKYRITMLLNMYRELLMQCLDGIQHGNTDTADIVVSLAKKDTIMRRLDISILEDTEDWEWTVRQWRKAQIRELPELTP